MAAIRRNRNDVADYLIDQLAVNVQYAADLREFRLRSRIPCRHRTFTCRDLAYEKGMMELVDLIDLTSKDVKPNIKRYLKARLQPRLNYIHQAYLKRLEQRKHHLFQPNQTIEHQRTSTEDGQSTGVQPSFKSHSYRSFVEESTENIAISSSVKSIDETGKKTFRFSNYTLRFRLDEKAKTKTENQQRSPLRKTLSTTSLFASTSTPSFTTYNTSHPIKSTNSRPSTRNVHRSICSPVRQPTLPQITRGENKPSMTNSIEHPSPKRIQYTNHSQSHALYNQSRYFVPVTLKSTALGLPSNTRLIRD